MSQAATADLGWLPEETWGQKLARARVSSRVGLRRASQLVSTVLPASFASVSRLEELPEVPADPRRRMLATLVVVSYGVQPEAFGLSFDDLPRSIDVDDFIRQAQKAKRGSDQPKEAFGWTFVTPGHKPEPALLAS